MKACGFFFFPKVLMFISASEIICTSRADKCLWSPTCQYTCSFRAVAPAALAETNTTDQQTWKSCKLSARRPRQIFKLDTTANSNSGLETVVFSQFVTVLNHDSVCVCVCVRAGHSFLCGADGGGAGGGHAEDGSLSGHHQWRYHLHLCWDDLQTPHVSVRCSGSSDCLI